MNKINKLYDHVVNDYLPSNIGMLFNNIYESPCHAFICYIGDDNETYVIDALNDTIVPKKLKNTINSPKLIAGLQNDPNFIVTALNHEHYIAYSTDKEILMCVSSDIDSGTCKTVKMYANEDDDSIKEALSPYIHIYNKETKLSFGIATMVPANGSLYTSDFDYTKVNIDVKNNYNDDLPYDRICSILEDDTKANLMLFYGEPGTGKSSLLKHLISIYPDREFIFIDGNLLHNCAQDKLLAYFIEEGEKAVFIMEDCEKVLASRDKENNPFMSTLLNFTDGIIADVLCTTFICTFNTNLSNIDKALLRKGRLTLKYEFKALAKEKARKLLNDETINKDMPLSDIYYYKTENDYSKKKTGNIGF